jgi:hypothetical protein
MTHATIRRFALLVSIVLTGSLAFAASSQAAGPPPGKGGGFLPAGNYVFTAQRASYNLFSNDPSQPQIGLFVSGGPSVSRPLGGPATTTNMVTMFFNIFSYSGVSGGGCVILTNPADFSISSDLHTAALHTTVTDGTQLCGGPLNLPLPIQIDVTWSGVGPIETSNDAGTFACSGYTSESHTTDTSNNANANLSISSLAGSFPTTAAGMGIRSQTIHAQGATPPDTCGGGIGGKGAGRGLPAAGNSVFTRTEADASLFSPDPSTPQMFVSASANTSTSNPLGGPATASSETDVLLFINSPSVNGFGCFVVNSSDLSISPDLASANLHTTLTADTPACGGGSNSLGPLPLTLDVSWVGSGPIATTRDDGQLACGAYHTQTNLVQTVNNGGASTISISGVTGSFSGPGSTASNTTRVHADGVADPACTFRG